MAIVNHGSGLVERLTDIVFSVTGCSGSLAELAADNIADELEAASCSHSGCYFKVRADAETADPYHLENYAIVPLEEYEALTETVRKWREERE